MLGGRLGTWCMDLQELLKLYQLLSWVRKRCSLFQTTASWGLGRAGEIGVVLTISVLMVEALNLGSGNSGITKLRLAWVVMGLNASPLRLLFQGPTWTPLTKGCPWSTCSILELGNCKVVERWEVGRKPGTTRYFPRGSLHMHVLQDLHLSHDAPGASTPGSGAYFHQMLYIQPSEDGDFD